MVREVIPTLDLAISLNPNNQNIIIPMLEDNLDLPSYRSMRDIVAEIIGPKALIIRNPCTGDGCVPGTDWESTNEPIEHHAPYPYSALKRGDGYTLDGAGLSHPGDLPLGKIGLPEAKILVESAQAKEVAYVGLWRFERQGLTRGKIDPGLRDYELPTEEQALREIEILRAGLLPVEDEEL
jgi:hypothetical protein